MRASIETRHEENRMHIAQNCSNCSTASRCRRRDFSEQAWSVLLAWGEVESRVVDQPICDDCYGELREILIDRAEELSEVIANPDQLRTAQAERAVVNKKKKAAAPAPKKKAGRAVTAKKKTRRVA